MTSLVGEDSPSALDRMNGTEYPAQVHPYPSQRIPTTGFIYFIARPCPCEDDDNKCTLSLANKFNQFLSFTSVLLWRSNGSVLLGSTRGQ